MKKEIKVAVITAREASKLINEMFQKTTGRNLRVVVDCSEDVYDTVFRYTHKNEWKLMPKFDAIQILTKFKNKDYEGGYIWEAPYKGYILDIIEGCDNDDEETETLILERIKYLKNKYQ